MVLTRRVSVFLLAVGVFNWIIWLTFLKNISADDRSFDNGSPTGFFLVHLVLIAVSLVIGTIVGVIGWRGFAAQRTSVQQKEAAEVVQR